MGVIEGRKFWVRIRLYLGQLMKQIKMRERELQGIMMTILDPFITPKVTIIK